MPSPCHHHPHTHSSTLERLAFSPSPHRQVPMRRQPNARRLKDWGVIMMRGSPWFVPPASPFCLHASILPYICLSTLPIHLHTSHPNTFIFACILCPFYYIVILILSLCILSVTLNVLIALGGSTIHLHSLALAPRVHLTGSSIIDFPIRAPAAARVQKLTLYGDETFPSPLTTEDLAEIASSAPCFTCGGLTYLDLSSAPVTRELLIDVFQPQPKLQPLACSD